LLQNLRIWQKLTLIGVVFVLPIAVLLFFVISSMNADSQFSIREKEGNHYQRPLEQLFLHISQHKLLAERYLNGSHDVGSAISDTEREIHSSFSNLMELQRQYGKELLVTQEELAKRQREHVIPETIQKEWDALEKDWKQDGVDVSNEQHLHLIQDVRVLMTHIGDTSNLILDPDLDTAYLMEVLTSIPEMQEQIQEAMAFAEGILRQGTPADAEKIKLNVYTALLQADMNRINSSAQTALNEDTGHLASLHDRLPPALQQNTAQVGSFIGVTWQISSPTPVAMKPDDYAAEGMKSLEQSFQLWNIASEELDQLLERRIQALRLARMKAMLLTTLAVALSCLLVFLIIRSIVLPLEKLVRVSRQLSIGDLSTDIGPRGTDETGQLLQSMSEMLKYLKEMAEQADRIAGGNLNVQIQPRSPADRFGNAFRQMTDYLNETATVADEIADGNLSLVSRVRSSEDTFGKSFQKMVDKLKEVTNNLKSTTNLLANSSGRIVVSSRRTLESAQNQAAAVQQLSSSASELHETSHITGQRAGEIQKMLHRTAETSQAIRSQLGDTATAMSQIQEQIRIIVDSIRSVSEKNVQIGEIIESVSELADQSQLLAINAGIEAAKAGDSGKGFSVVASEMKTLADQSKSAARRIRTIVNEVLKGANDAAGVAQSGQGRFQDSLEEIQPVLQQVEDLTVRVDESNQAVQQILAIVNQQIIGIEQITGAMKTIHSGVQEGLQQNEQMQEAAETLNSIGQNLQRIVETYRLLQ